MLIQPTQNNIINARTLQSPPQRYPTILNPYNNAGNTKIFVGNSPPVKVIRQPQRLSYTPVSNYMMHLVPQQPTIVSPVVIFNPNPNIDRSASLSLANKFTDQKSQPPTQSILTVQRPQRVIINNSCSKGYRSRGTSELSNKKSKLINCKNEYMIPQSPNHLKKMQPIRRVSQHKLNISTSDNQVQQQQNIRIIIQTDTISQLNSTPSKITIEHIQGANNNQITATNGAFIITTQPKAQNSPVTNDTSPKVALFSENKLNGSTNLVEKNVINSATYSQIAPATFEMKTENRGISYSLDSKNPQKQNKNKAQIKSKFKSRNEVSQPQIIVLDPPSSLFIDKKPISFSVQQPNSQFKDSQSSKKNRIQKKQKEEEQQQSTSNHEKNKLSLESSKANLQERKKILKEVYNEYYDDSDELIQSSMKETTQRKNYLIYNQHKSIFASAFLLNQIYENEVHKALLRMNVVQNRSREKSIKRRNY